MNEVMLCFDDVWYRYPASRDWVLKGLNVTVHRGEFIALVGENGAGKTTFCKCLNGIIPHSERGRFRGMVRSSGLDTKTVPTSELALHVGMVLEDPDTQLFTTSVLNEVAFGPENILVEPEEILERARWALQVVKLQGYENRSPSSLSGGEKQRLAIASVLAMNPAIMVLDEPTSQLDPLGTEEVFSVINELKNRHGMTIIMASHKMEELIQFADRVLVLHRGEIAAFDTPENVFRNDQLLDLVRIARPSPIALSAYLQRCQVPVPTFSTIQEGEREIRSLLGKGKLHHG